MANTNKTEVLGSLFFNLGFKLRFMLTLLSIVCYCAATVLLYDYIGNEAYMFLILPAVAASSFFGFKGGVPVIALSPAITLFIQYLRHDWSDPAQLEITPLVVSVVICIVAAVAISFLRDLQQRLKIETGIRMEIETDKAMQSKSLKELESRLRIIFEYASIGFYRITPEGSIVMVNPALLKMMKYPFFEIVFQQDMSSRYFPHYSVPDFKDRIMNEGRLIGTESLWERYDGSSIYVYETAWQILDENGNLLFIDGIISDITEKKHAEQALKENMEKLEKEIAVRKKTEQTLKESEEKFRDIVEKAGIVITIDDTEGSIKYFNNQLLEVFGYTQNEASRMKIFDLVHEDDLEKVRKYHSDRMAGRPCPSRYEFKGLTKRNETIYLEIENVTLSDNENIVGTRSYMWDISERKLTEKALIENEERLRGIFDNATVGFYRTTPEGRVLLANQTMLNILKFPSIESMINNNINISADFMEDRTQFKKQLEKEGRIFGRQYQWKRADGSYAYVRESAWIIRDRNNEPIFYEGIVEDITAQVVAEEEYHLTRSELEKLRHELKLLHSLLPICTSCMKIRQGRDKWIHIHEYIRSNPDGDYGEKLCPDCLARMTDIAEQGTPGNGK